MRANSVDPDQMSCSVAFDLGLHCLLSPVCPNTQGYYGNEIARLGISKRLTLTMLSINFSR